MKFITFTGLLSQMEMRWLLLLWTSVLANPLFAIVSVAGKQNPFLFISGIITSAEYWRTGVFIVANLNAFPVVLNLLLSRSDGDSLIVTEHDIFSQGYLHIDHSIIFQTDESFNMVIQKTKQK